MPDFEHEETNEEMEQRLKHEAYRLDNDNRLKMMAEKWQAGVTETELFTAARNHDISKVKKLFQAWKKTSRTGAWDRLMEQTLSASLETPPKPGATETAISPVTQYLLRELPDVWAVRPAEMVSSWGTVLDRVSRQFQSDRCQNIEIGGGWTSESIIGVIVSLITAGADPGGIVDGANYLSRKVSIMVDLMRKMSATLASGLENEDVIPQALEAFSGAWACDVDTIKEETQSLASWMIQVIEDTFPKATKEELGSYSILIGEHGRINLMGGRYPVPIMMIDIDKNMKDGLTKSLSHRVFEIVDRVPPHLFFQAAGRCLMWPEEKEGQRPGRSWTAKAEYAGDAGRSLDQLIRNGDLVRKNLKIGSRKNSIDWAGRILKHSFSDLERIKRQRTWNLARATSVDDTCRTMVDIFLLDVVQNWLPVILSELDDPAEKNENPQNSLPIVPAIIPRLENTQKVAADYQEKLAYRKRTMR